MALPVPASPDPRWRRAWIVAAAAGGALAAGSHAAGVLRGASVWRIRDFGWTPILRRLAERADVDLLAALPAAVSWHVQRPLESAALLLKAMLASALLCALVATLALPLVAVLARRLAVAERARLAVSAGLGLFALPALELPLARALRDVPSGPTLLWSGAATLALCALLAALLDARRARALVRLASRALLVLAVATPVVALAAHRRTLRDDAARPAPPAGAPSLLLVSIDSLRADHLGCYGYARDTSPGLDALAREGTRFATVVSSSSWTLPAHVTLFTGLAAERHGVVRDERRIAEEASTLAEVLRDAGWRTAGVASGPYLEAGFGFAQGFDVWDDWSANRSSERFSHRGATSALSIAAAERLLDEAAQRDPDRPVFLFLHLWDVHYDYEPPPPWDVHFDPDYRGAVTGRDFEQGSAVHREMDPRDLAHVVALYDGEIRHTDESLAGLVARLRERGILDRTVVAVVADHGDEFFEHGDKGHRNNLYDTTLLVPWILRWPGRVAAGRVVTEPVGLQDVAPTLLGLLGVAPPPAPAAGTGEAGARGDAAPGNAALSDTAQGRDLGAALAPGAQAALAPAAITSDLHGELAALRTATTKWIAGPKGEELYDLVRDPGEQENRASEEPERAAALRESLAARRAATAAGLARPIELDDAQRERLRALGYLE